MVETAGNSGNRAPARSQNVKAQKPQSALMQSPLPNQRQEAFCHHIAKGETADRAYQLAGFKPNRGNASVLKSKQIIKDRIAVLQGQITARMIEKVAVDKAYVLDRAVKLHEACSEEGEAFNPNASARFLEMVGRHVDVQAFREAQDINVHITVDQAIARLESQAIEADYEVIDGTADPD